MTEAFLLAAAVPACHGRIFNIGGSPPASLKELADLVRVRARAGFELCHPRVPGRPGRIDIGSYYADDRAFRAATAGRPVGLEEGIRPLARWFCPRLGDYL